MSASFELIIFHAFVSIGLAGVFAYLLKPSVECFSSRTIKYTPGQDYIKIWFVYLWAAVLGTIFGVPIASPINGSLVPLSVVVSSVLVVVGIARLLTIRYSVAICDNIYIWIPSAVGVFIFLTLDQSRFIQGSIETIIGVSNPEFQQVSLVIFVLSILAVLYVELIAKFLPDLK
jgi:hypothetical protein